MRTNTKPGATPMDNRQHLTPDCGSWTWASFNRWSQRPRSFSLRLRRPDVIKVEPPIRRPYGGTGQPDSAASRKRRDAYPWQPGPTANKAGPGSRSEVTQPRKQGSRAARQVGRRAHRHTTPHPGAPKRLKTWNTRMWCRWNPRLIYADITGFPATRGPDADLAGFDITSYWGAQRHVCR